MILNKNKNYFMRHVFFIISKSFYYLLYCGNMLVWNGNK